MTKDLSKRSEKARASGGMRTTKAPATQTPQEFSVRRRKRLLDLMGKLEWDRTYDYKAERGR
jgi:hypothetical protein